MAEREDTGTALRPNLGDAAGLASLPLEMQKGMEGAEGRRLEIRRRAEEQGRCSTECEQTPRYGGGGSQVRTFPDVFGGESAIDQEETA